VFSWIGRLFGQRTAVDTQRSNPVLEAAVQKSALVFDQIPLRDFIDEERRKKLARDLYLEMNRISNTADPLTACRDQFVATMLKLASYQVLVIPPQPEEDRSGLRNQPGISGELKAYLVDLCEKDDDLRSTMFAETESQAFDDLWEIVQRLYWETYWLMGSLDGIRIALGDSVEGDDWRQAFLHAACVKSEHAYRWQLELPPAFDESIAKEAANSYSVFTDIVLSGAINPAAEWRDYCAGSGIPMPDFGAVST
jgi:hypothetical protein